jgi:hypothetical protein
MAGSVISVFATRKVTPPQQKQKGPPASGGRPGGTHKIVLLFDPSLKNAQEKLDTICQNLPEAAVTSAGAEEGQ